MSLSYFLGPGERAYATIAPMSISSLWPPRVELIGIAMLPLAGVALLDIGGCIEKLDQGIVECWDPRRGLVGGRLKEPILEQYAEAFWGDLEANARELGIPVEALYTVLEWVGSEEGMKLRVAQPPRPLDFEDCRKAVEEKPGLVLASVFLPREAVQRGIHADMGNDPMLALSYYTSAGVEFLRVIVNAAGVRMTVPMGEGLAFAAVMYEQPVAPGKVMPALGIGDTKWPEKRSQWIEKLRRDFSGELIHAGEIVIPLVPPEKARRPSRGCPLQALLSPTVYN